MLTILVQHEKRTQPKHQQNIEHNSNKCEINVKFSFNFGFGYLEIYNYVTNCDQLKLSTRVKFSICSKSKLERVNTNDSRRNSTITTNHHHNQNIETIVTIKIINHDQTSFILKRSHKTPFVSKQNGIFAIKQCQYHKSWLNCRGDKA